MEFLNKIGSFIKGGLMNGSGPNWLGVGLTALLAGGTAYFTSGMHPITMILATAAVGVGSLAVGSMVSGNFFGAGGGPISSHIPQASSSVEALQNTTARGIEQTINEKRRIDHLIILADARELQENRGKDSSGNVLMATPVSNAPRYADRGSLNEQARELSQTINRVLNDAEHFSSASPELDQYVDQRKQSLLNNSVYREILISSYGGKIPDVNDVNIADMYRRIEASLDEKIIELRGRQWYDGHYISRYPYKNAAVPNKIQEGMQFFDNQQYGSLQVKANNARVNYAAQGGNGYYQEQNVDGAKDFLAFNEAVQARQQLYDHMLESCKQCIQKSQSIEPIVEPGQTEEQDKTASVDSADMQRALDAAREGDVDLGKLKLDETSILDEQQLASTDIKNLPKGDLAIQSDSNSVA